MSSMIYSKYDGCSSVKVVAFQPLTWEQCTTLDKKIGFIVGNSLSYLVATSGRVLNNVNQVLHLDKVAQYVLKTLKWAITKLFDGISKTIDVADKFIKSVFTNEMSKTAFKWSYNQILSPVSSHIKKVANFIFVTVLWKEVAVPVFNHIIKPILNTINSICLTTERKAEKASSQTANKSIDLQPLWRWTTIPLYNRILSPVGQAMSELFHMAIRESKKAIKLISSWTLSPLYHHVLSPVGKTTSNLIYGIVSGCMNTDRKQDIKKDPHDLDHLEEDLSSDDETLTI